MNWEEIRSRESLTAKESKYICNDLMSTGLEMERLIVENFGPEDYYKVAQRRIGGGRIGGKACGLLLARKLIQARMPNTWIIWSRTIPILLARTYSIIIWKKMTAWS